MLAFHRVPARWGERSRDLGSRACHLQLRLGAPGAPGAHRALLEEAGDGGAEEAAVKVKEFT